MKVMGINNDGTPGMIDLDTTRQDPRKAELAKICTDIMVAADNWYWSKGQKEQRYTQVGDSNFVLMLMSIDNLLAFINSTQLSDHEKEELKNFMTSLK